MGTFSYQWRSDGADIIGATDSTFAPTLSEVGQAITVVAKYTDGNGAHESVLSGPTDLVVIANNPLVGDASIDISAPTQGDTLTASNNFSDGDGLGAFSYQWKADGVNIAGATGGTFVLGEAQVGKSITVVGSYVDGHGVVETSQPSVATAPVVNFEDLPTGNVYITGYADASRDIGVGE